MIARRLGRGGPGGCADHDGDRAHAAGTAHHDGDRAEAAGGVDTTEPADSGRALIEVVFLAVLVLIPIAYILASVLRIQSATFAVSQAARDAGRLIETAPDPYAAADRARQVAAVALTDQHLPTDQLTVNFVAAGQDCHSAANLAPSLQPGAVYDVCVVAVITLPGVPSVLTGSANTVTGVYTVHIGELREGS